MEDNTYIEFLQKLCDKVYRQGELNEFVEQIINVAQTYVVLRYNRVKYINNLTFDSPKDIAIDAIAPLFQTINDENIFVLTDEIRKWVPPIETEKDAFFFINKVISRRIDQHISFLLRESDPFFSKLLDSVNYLIRTQGFYKSVYLGKTFILENEDSINDKTISADEFEKLPLNLFLDRKKILLSIFNYLNSETKFFPAIPLNELIKRMKEINLSGFLLIDAAESHNLKEIEIDEIIKRSLGFIKQKINETYVKKGKLSTEEGDVFIKTLTDMAYDLRNGGINPGLYEYYSKYSPELSKEEFLYKYNNILEYVLRLLKEKIAEETRVN